MDISFSPLSCQYPIAYLEVHVVRVMGGTEQRCHSKEKALSAAPTPVLLGGIKRTASFLRVCKADRIPTLFHPPGRSQLWGWRQGIPARSSLQCRVHFQSGTNQMLMAHKTARPKK